MLWLVALSFDAKSRDIMVTGMYYLSGGYLPGGNYAQLLFIFPLTRSGKFALFLFAHPPSGAGSKKLKNFHIPTTVPYCSMKLYFKKQWHLLLYAYLEFPVLSLTTF